MGIGKFFKRFVQPLAPLALAAIPGVGLPLAAAGGAAIGAAGGGGLKGALTGGITGAIGGGAGGALGNALGATGATGSALGTGILGAAAGGVNGGLQGALLGGAAGGIGGYLTGGGMTDLLNSTGLSSGLNSASNYLGFGDVVSPAIDTARAATGASAIGNASYGAPAAISTGAPSVGGGSSGGFFGGLGKYIGFGDTAGDIASNGLQVGKATDLLRGDVIGQAVTGAPAAINAGTQAATQGGTDMLGKFGGIAKYLAPALMAKDNSRGYQQVQNAAMQSAENYQPFLDTGAKANQTLEDLYGLNGQDAAAAATQNWQNTPGYQFARDQGIQALDASAASRGMLRSGNQMQAVQDYGTGLANQYYNDYLRQLANARAAGQDAAQGVGQGTMTAADAFAKGKDRKANSYNQLLYGLAQYI